MQRTSGKNSTKILAGSRREYYEAYSQRRESLSVFFSDQRGLTFTNHSQVSSNAHPEAIQEGRYRKGGNKDW